MKSLVYIRHPFASRGVGYNSYHPSADGQQILVHQDGDTNLADSQDATPTGKRTTSSEIDTRHRSRSHSYHIFV